MKIGILSREPKSYSTRRLTEAAKGRGHVAKILDPTRFSIEVASGRPELYFKGKALEHIDAVIPRVGASITFFGTAVVRQLEQMGIFCVNSSTAISTSRDKLRALQILSRHRIGIPVTSFVRHKNEMLSTMERMTGPPIVVKLLEGSQGVGVLLAETKKAAEGIVEALQFAAGKNVLLQECVEESRGRDIRALVTGGRVVAAMRRVAEEGEFRSNVHRGGRVEPVELDPEYERVAIHAAQILGLRVAGVDLLEGRDGPVLMEVNSSPGFEGIEAATGVDVADAVIALIEEEVLFPEIDIRQRLTLQSGYGVMEIPVEATSELCGKTVQGSGLRDRDVMVLQIQRGSVTIPNPKTTREILAGDTVLCFGKMLTLRGFAPRSKSDAAEGAPAKKAKKKKKSDEENRG